MLSVIIETRDHEAPLALTLASLVSAAVEGVVREVIVIDRGSRDATRIVADHAGCRLLEQGGLSSAIRAARADWLLLAEPGARFADGWSDSVRDHVVLSGRPARLTAERSRSPSWAWLLRPGRSNPLAGALVIRRAGALGLAGRATGAAELARLAAPLRIAGLIRPAVGR